MYTDKYIHGYTLYACIQTYIHIYIDIYIYICRCICIHIYIYIYRYIYMYMCMYMYMKIPMHMYMYTYMCAAVHVLARRVMCLHACGSHVFCHIMLHISCAYHWRIQRTSQACTQKTNGCAAKLKNNNIPSTRASSCANASAKTQGLHDK